MVSWMLGLNKATPTSIWLSNISHSSNLNVCLDVNGECYLDDAQHVVSVLLEIATTKESSTGKNIFKLLDQALAENNILWKTVTCFSADNAAVMMGVHNVVAAFVREKNPEVFVNGFPCHLLHPAAEKGAQQLPSSPVDLLIPIYYYLEKSSNRYKAFCEVRSCCDVKQHTILKHVCSTWLSLEHALNRLLEQWVPLVEFFRSESETSFSSSAPKKKNDQPKTTAKEVQPQPQKKNTGHAPGRAKVSMTSSKSVSGKSSTSSESSSSGKKRKIESDYHQSRGKHLKTPSSPQVHPPNPEEEFWISPSYCPNFKLKACIWKIKHNSCISAKVIY